MTLVLDDDLELLHLIERKLKSANIPCRTYTDDQLFIHNLDNSIYVIVVDHNLKHNLTGLDLYYLIKAKNKANFIIGYSGVVDPKVLIDYINSGIDGFVDKDDTNHLENLVISIQQGLKEAERRGSFLAYIESKLPGMGFIDS